MSIESQPQSEENIESKKILHIEIDEIPEVDTFIHSIESLSIEEKLEKVSEFIKSKFKNAISPDARNLPPAEREKISEVFDQKNMRKLSRCLELGYGVCVEYHVLGKAIFDKLGIPCEFKTGRLQGGPGHTFLDIQIDGKWHIFDPFAEVYMNERGSSSKLFHPDYYLSSRVLEEEK